MLKRINPEELDKAFDGDFGKVPFDHYPTPEDIHLVRLGLVAQAQLDAVKKELLDKLEPLEHPETGKIIGASLILTKEEYQQLRENK